MTRKKRSMIVRIWLALRFLAFYTGELILANMRVAMDVLTPRLRSNPGIIGVRLCDLTDLQLFVLSSLVTMTPGTMSIDVSEDRCVLFVHHMFLPDPEEARRQIEEDYVQRIREIF
ncbi:MAG: Na+/H+ antiporter subunit E [Bacteroidetes bacterium]|nr:Na+/H+ antiporter subunit E [Bacteroidota bacterium]